MTIRLLLAQVIVFGASVVHADDYVNNADANGDGFVSLYELRAAYYADPDFNQRIEQSFADYDLNGDGLISDAERRTASRDAGEVPKNEQIQNVSMETGRFETPDADGERTTEGEVRLIDESAHATDRRDVIGSDPERREAGGAGKADGEDGRREEPGAGSQSRTELWVAQIDADKSGGASKAELTESGGGQPWFTDKEFAAADRNGDGELDPAELGLLMSGIERRHH